MVHQNTSPIVALCTTCKGRTTHLQRTLPQNLSDNRNFTRLKFILVNYNSQDHLEEYIAEHQERIESGLLTVYRFTEPGPFRMAHAKNLAHRLGMREGATVLVNLDADNYTGTGFAEYVAGKMAGKPDRFLWSRMIKSGPGRLDRGISGRIAVTKEAFLNAGGYDEKYSSWSPDDKDFNHRLRRLGYQAEEIDPRYLLAIRHTDKMRFREYPDAAGCDSSDFELDEETHTIVNQGRVGMGVVYRNGSPEPIEMGAMPTRIFGIGMHKTATTSLHSALTLLGYPSAHWISAHWAKAIWNEMQDLGRSPTLEKHYAVCDLPIPMLYRELDRAYPGAKFILTMRGEGEWLDSCRKHWDYNLNRFRASWDHDPFSHKIHRIIYGRKSFDEEVFLARYRQHNREVLEYFRDRPQDLLVMDMSRGAGWYELCGFLRQPIPRMPYPKAFRTKDHPAGYLNLGENI